jgi:hypothetical protein
VTRLFGANREKCAASQWSWADRVIVISVNLDNAIKYWKQQLTDRKSINRVRVRRILAMEGAERRGFAIMRRISNKFEANGLRTVPATT